MPLLSLRNLRNFRSIFPYPESNLSKQCSKWPHQIHRLSLIELVSLSVSFRVPLKLATLRSSSKRGSPSVISYSHCYLALCQHLQISWTTMPLLYRRQPFHVLREPCFLIWSLLLLDREFF